MSETVPWVPGTVHPTGGYDTVAASREETLYRLGSVLHWLDGPAEISAYDGITLAEQWRAHGALHREGGPASIVNRADGSLPRVDYFLHGRLSRSDGPATITYHSDGKVDAVEWRTDGVRHRTDGPAVYGYDEFENLEYASFHVRGHRLSEDVFTRFREAIEGGAPEEWALAFVTGQTS